MNREIPRPSPEDAARAEAVYKAAVEKSKNKSAEAVMEDAEEAPMVLTREKPVFPEGANIELIDDEPVNISTIQAERDAEQTRKTEMEERKRTAGDRLQMLKEMAINAYDGQVGTAPAGTEKLKKAA